MPEGEENPQSGDFVARVDSMDINEVRSEFYGLFSEALDIENAEQEGAA
jgi:hypothetical protein